MKLVDTTFLIHHYTGRDDAVDYKEENSSETFLTTGVNIKEFMIGHIRADYGPELTMYQIQDEFGWLRIEPFIGAFGFEAAEIEAQLRNSDQYKPRLAGDILIGGAARELGADVVTKNVSDFEPMPGVSVDEY